MIKREITVNKVKLSPLDTLLEIWAGSYNHADIDTGFLKKCVGVKSESLLDSEQLYDRSDTVIVEAMDAIISDMKSANDAHFWAIQYKMGLAKIWKCNQKNYFTEISNALQELERRAKRNTTTGAIFN